MDNIKQYTSKHGTVVFVKSSAIVNNIQLLKKQIGSSILALVLKNNAYGFGLSNIFNIVKPYTQDYFVATFKEAIDLRTLDDSINIYVLNGIMQPQVDDFVKHNLIPVLNTLSQISIWQAATIKFNKKLLAILQVETGINRLALTEEEVNCLVDNPKLLKNIEVLYIMSHLACTEIKDHYSIELQHRNFINLTNKLPKAKHSISASGGTLLGDKVWYKDMVRIALSIYGGNALPYTQNIMDNVLYMYSEILQVKHIKENEGVGYGYKFIAKAPKTIAIIPVGYGDGFIKAAANKAYVFIGGKKCLVIGTISMDLVVADITDIDEKYQKEGELVEIFGDNVTVTDTTYACGTNACEVFNSITSRYPVIFIK